MTKFNTVRPGIMSLIRVKDKGKIIGEAWLDLIHNNGYVDVPVTSSPTPEPEPEPTPTPTPTGTMIKLSNATGLQPSSFKAYYNTSWQPFTSMEDMYKYVMQGNDAYFFDVCIKSENAESDNNAVIASKVSASAQEPIPLEGTFSLWLKLTSDKGGNVKYIPVNLCKTFWGNSETDTFWYFEDSDGIFSGEFSLADGSNEGIVQVYGGYYVLNHASAGSVELYIERIAPEPSEE